MNLFYEACRPIMAGLLWTLADFRLDGAELVPRKGPLIVASNHLHNCDPPLLGGVLPRYVRFMAKREAFKFPWGWLFASAYGAFPVNRGQIDRRALREAERILAGGGVVGMFPEGHRSHGKGLLPA
ncbi:MAG TPA: lysophospholipid acyltransferase family protein, partial [Chloroflexota bacterium]